MVLYVHIIVLKIAYLITPLKVLKKSLKFVLQLGEEPVKVLTNKIEGGCVILHQ